MAGKAKDLSGRKFGRLTVACRSIKKDSANNVYWDCLCECGNRAIVRSSHLTKGHTLSCGCYGRECLEERTRHGKHDSRIYHIWENMLQRCNNEKARYFGNYGGRGIEVCDRWHKFEAFYEDMGDAPSDNHTLDRIDNDGNYCKDNCQWATRGEQMSHTRNNHILTFNGENLTVSEWSKRVSIKANTIICRLLRGWSVDNALTVPIRNNGGGRVVIP